MNRIDLIFKHPLYKEKYNKLLLAEKDRIFCNHTLEHFMDVARLMYIRYLESGIELSEAVNMSANTDKTENHARDIIYATALMHDIGRIDQIENNIPHDVASAKFCDIVLPGCGFSQNEIAMIQDAILKHRNDTSHFNTPTSNSQLATLLYWADKQSRNCFVCDAYDKCNWSSEKRNLQIII